MPITNYDFGVSSFGVPLFGAGGLIPVPGNVYWVDPTNGSTSGSGETPQDALKTLSAAHSLMTANQNDVAILIGNASASSSNVVYETSSLSWTKDMCHIVGAMAFNRVSHRVSIRGDATPTTQVAVSADGCLFSNFHTFDAGTDSSQIGWNDTGQRNAYHNIHFGFMGSQTAADAAGAIGVQVGGSGNGEHFFHDCTFGLDTVDRGAANASLVLTGGTTRNIFRDCRFIMRADATTGLFVKIGSGGIDRWVSFENCRFINSGIDTGGSTLTEAFNVNASAGGSVLLDDRCHVVGAGDWEDTQSGVVYVAAALAAATSGRMVLSTT